MGPLREGSGRGAGRSARPSGCEAARRIDWIEAPTIGLDDSAAPLYRWFPDGVLNTCANAVDRHVAAGRGDVAAIRYDSPVTGTKAHDHLRRTARPGLAASRASLPTSASAAATGSSSTCR